MKHQKRALQFDAGNMESARIIATNPARYGGGNSLMVRWALLVLEREQRERATRDDRT